MSTLSCAESTGEIGAVRHRPMCSVENSDAVCIKQKLTAGSVRDAGAPLEHRHLTVGKGGGDRTVERHPGAVTEIPDVVLLLRVKRTGCAEYCRNNDEEACEGNRHSGQNSTKHHRDQPKTI